MLSIALPLILATAGLANPMSMPQASNNGVDASGGALARCEAATNCETYTDVSGQLRTRFVPGMEPGSKDYEHRVALAKRDPPPGFPQTSVSFGDEQVSWGCDAHPLAELGNIGSICSDGSCEGSPYDLSILWVPYLPGGTAEAIANEKLEIGATGHYPPWFHDGLVQAVQLAMSADGIIHWYSNQGYSQGTLKERDDIREMGAPAGWDGECNIAITPTKIGLSVYSSNDTVEALIHVTITTPNISPGFCASATTALGVAGSVAGMFDGAGPVIAGVCGIASASCAA